MAAGGFRIDDLDLVRVVEQSELQQNYSETEKGAADDAEWREQKLIRERCEHLCGFVNELTESRIDIAAA